MKNLAIIIISLLFIVTIGFATTINIPADYTTIQAGIDASSNGDTVLVQPGTYVEKINYNGKNIVVGSLILITGDTSYISQTVIDGDSLGTVVTFENQEDSTAILTGFTIQNGTGSFWPESGQGGGITCINNSNPMLSYLFLQNNIAERGGGLHIRESHIKMSNCIIENNNALFGNGIYIHYNASLVLSNSILRKNTQIEPDFSGYGGGIYASDTTNIIFINVKVDSNSAHFGGGIAVAMSEIIVNNSEISNNFSIEGGGFNIWRSISKINFTKIHNNEALIGGGIAGYNSSSDSTLVILINRSNIYNNLATYGGGAHFSMDGGIIITNSVFYSNQATGNGGGIYYQHFVNINVINTIFWENSPYQISCLSVGAPTSLLVTYCLIQNGLNGLSGPSYHTLLWNEGNISQNPEFINSLEFDFNLSTSSPGIDAGTAFYVWEEDTLINIDQNDYVGNAPDMGAFESLYIVSINEEQILPVKFALYRNYPNPFNPITTIQYELPQQSVVQITIYDLLGKKVTTLVSETQDAGFKSISWNATNDYGKPVSAGVYLYKIQAGEFVQTKKMILLK
ncbi:MAG: T9SS type A sorting domain-containing protein [Planctomycetia bacterium]|nr:T9SS type A sorting domain-containing protein [Planctomycetia bacterium]